MIATEGPSSRDFGIAIGIDRYPDLDSSLTGAVQDATDFHGWLRSAGVPSEHAKLIISPNRGRARPVHDEIDVTFDRFLVAATNRGARRLYVYFAGHGFSVRANHVNLLLANATRRLLNRGLDASEYQEALMNGPFDELVCLYDCCRTFDARATGLGPQFLTPERDPLRHVSQVILYAVQLGTESAERTTRDGRTRGVFTRALLEGLDGGGAVLRGNRYDVTAASLSNFLGTRMEQIAEEDGVLQQISLQVLGADKSLVLAEDVEPWLMPVVLRVRDATATTVTVRGGVRPTPVPVSAGMARLKLPSGMYSAESDPDRAYLTFEVHAGKPLDEVLA